MKKICDSLYEMGNILLMALMIIVFFLLYHLTSNASDEQFHNDYND